MSEIPQRRPERKAPSQITPPIYNVERKMKTRKPKNAERKTRSRIETRKAGCAAPNGLAYWPLFKHMSDNHGLTLLDSEMEDICRVVLLMRVPTNWLDPLLTGDRKALTGQAGKWGCLDIENLLNAIRTGKDAQPQR